eukprot:5798748-Alexandrium_andersonii.AAC.1
MSLPIACLCCLLPSHFFLVLSALTCARIRIVLICSLAFQMIQGMIGRCRQGCPTAPPDPGHDANHRELGEPVSFTHSQRSNI